MNAATERAPFGAAPPAAVTFVNPSDQASPQVSQLVEHLFRQEAGKMVAILTRIFGVEHLTLAEDVVQEALARALQTWPFYGVPANPSAWLMRAARNLALDRVRRAKLFREKQPEITRLFESQSLAPDQPPFSPEEIADDRLRLMFVCCHPANPIEAQVALALKTLCGFSEGEIGRAFLATEAAIAKRLTRAKQKIREAGVRFEIPAGAELSARLDGVLQVIYLLFNEGYKASAGERLIREELCIEAIRLGALLAEHAAGNQPRTHALMALMLLNAARTPSRTDGEGNMLRLAEQDRSRWDQGMIARGMFHLAQSAAGAELSHYHLQAAIAACHCRAKDFSATDWPQILALYDQLVGRDDSPVIALNRAIAVSQVQGAQAGLDAIGAIRNREKLGSYHLLYAAMGQLEAQLRQWPAAIEHFQKALELAELSSERRFLASRLEECQEQLV